MRTEAGLTADRAQGKVGGRAAGTEGLAVSGVLSFAANCSCTACREGCHCVAWGAGWRLLYWRPITIKELRGAFCASALVPLAVSGPRRINGVPPRDGAAGRIGETGASSGAERVTTRDEADGA